MPCRRARSSTIRPRLISGQWMQGVGELAAVDRKILENEHVSACHRIECGSVRRGNAAHLWRQLPVEARLGLPEDSDLIHQARRSGFGGHLDEYRVGNTLAGQGQPGSRRGARVAADYRHRSHGAVHDFRQEAGVEVGDRSRQGSGRVRWRDLWRRAALRGRGVMPARQWSRPGSLSRSPADLLVLPCSHANVTGIPICVKRPSKGVAMAGPLEGIRVVELGVWVAGPAAGGILADWGRRCDQDRTADP